MEATDGSGGTGLEDDTFMCMNCGCGEVDRRHKESDIVRSDIERAAEGQGSPLDETIRNIEEALGQVRYPGPTEGLPQRPPITWQSARPDPVRAHAAFSRPASPR